MRALSHCRCTVRTDTPRMRAISAKEKPQKNFKSTTSESEARRRPTRPAPRPRAPASNMIDDHPAHDSRGIGHKARAIRKRRTGLRGHVQVGLVQERCRAEAHRNAMASE